MKDKHNPQQTLSEKLAMPTALLVLIVIIVTFALSGFTTPPAPPVNGELAAIDIVAIICFGIMLVLILIFLIGFAIDSEKSLKEWKNNRK